MNITEPGLYLAETRDIFFLIKIIGKAPFLKVCSAVFLDTLTKAEIKIEDNRLNHYTALYSRQIVEIIKKVEL